MKLLIVLYIVGFLRTILIIVIIYYAIRLLSRYVLPLLVDKGIKNMQQKMQNQQSPNKHPSRPDGEVTIETKKTTQNRDSQPEGDYVDFEEVD
jgi:hypothetical protein